MTEPQDILEEQKEVFIEKNSDYSDTWIITGMALAALHDEPVELETMQDHVVSGNVHRLLDKILRGYNGAVIADEMNYESTKDSFTDAAVYCAMIASLFEDEPTERLDQAIENLQAAKDDNEQDTN